MCLLTLVVTYPAFFADFNTDDYVFLATARMVDAPFEAFWRSHFFEPVYFRPVGWILWWCSERLFGQRFEAHFALNTALHLANAALLWRLLARQQASVFARWIATLLFAVGPLSLPAIWWISNRFDLLATALCLLCLTAYFDLAKPADGRAVKHLSIAVIAALAACLSKEWAVPFLMVLAGYAIISGVVAKQRVQIVLGVLLLIIVLGTLVARKLVLGSVGTYASQGTLASFFNGVLAWFRGAAEIAMAHTRSHLWIGASVVALCVSTFVAAKQRRREMRAWGPSILLILLCGAVILPQCFAVEGFLTLVKRDIYGEASVTRFYYSAMAWVAVFLGLQLASFEWRNASRVAKTLVFALSFALLFPTIAINSKATDYAKWTHQEFGDYVSAATQAVDASLAQTSATTATTKAPAPCTFVFLGTQKKDPYFRMFADVAIKARVRQVQPAWSCHFLTESTPWLFIAAERIPRTALSLPLIDAAHGGKPDVAWGGIRYSYRLAPASPAELPGARYFEWQRPTFVDVTAEVQSGRRSVNFHGWGF